jgi:MYXO-CTERM domain-containing protein
MSRDAAVLVGAFALCCVLALALVGRDLERPGLYYDETIQATPALDFLAGGGRPAHVPGARAVWLFGGWFPLMTQPYMGALKSQLLVPVFALFGASPASLRLFTLGVGLLGVWLTMAWTQRVFGHPAAVLTGLLLAVDPSFLFIARHDWGSFGLGFALRAGALVWLTSGWTGRSLGRIAAGGLCLGLGVYNKIDFAVFVGAAALAVLAVWPGVARELLTRRRASALSGLGGFVLGAGPMLVAAGGALSAARQVSRGQGLGSPDWAEKWLTLTTLLDGSYFDRLMRAGGRFEHLGETTGAASGPGLLLLVAAVGLLVALRRRRASGREATDFALLAGTLTLLGIFLTPRAVRIHHFLNVLPFPQLLIAVAAVALWGAGGSSRWVSRPVAALAIGLAVTGSLHVDLRTLHTIRETGGRGRWSDALDGLARDLGRDPGTGRVVGLDWGFGGPFHFLAPELEVSEPFWSLRRAPGPVVVAERGTDRDVYVAFEAPYAVFPFGQAFLEAVAALPAGSVEVRSHADRTGDPAFRSVRFTGPHRVVYRGGGFAVELR